MALVPFKIQQVLKDNIPYPHDVVPKSETMYIVTARADDRVAAKAKIEQNLTTRNIHYVQGVKASSSIEGFKSTDATVDGAVIRIVVKPAKQSGAGAETTARGESFQAYASAARQNKSSDLDTADEVFERGPGRFADCNRTLEQCASLPSNWQYSGFKIANKLASFLGSGTYIFHRGGTFVKQLEDEFYFHKKKEALPIRDINKWNPADIWAVKSSFRMPRSHFQSITEYNQFLYEQFEARNLVGVSLKVLRPGAEPVQQIYNDTAVLKTVKLIGFTSTLTAKDAYLLFQQGSNRGRMQLRTFSSGTTGWQGEIKGASAAGGKVSGGPLEELLTSNVPNIRFLSFKQASAYVSRVTDALAAEMTKMYNDIVESRLQISVDDMKAALDKNNLGWRFSKYLSLQYASIIAKLPNTQQQRLLTDIIGYAASSTSFSSVFVKYS